MIGEIINQPSHVAKEIKQELLDNAAEEVVKQHSTECALTKFFTERQSETRLRIEDVRSLVTTDQASHPSSTAPSSIHETSNVLPVVTPVSQPLPVVTSTCPLSAESENITTLEKLPVVTITNQTLPVVTAKHTATATTDTQSAEPTKLDTLPVVTTISGTDTVVHVENAASLTPADTTPKQLVSDTPVAHAVESSTVAEMHPDPTLSLTPHVYRYYDVLNVTQDDIVSISHEELVTRTCDVSLDQLSQTDIEDIQSYLKGKEGTDQETPEQDVPKHLTGKSKCCSHRPVRKPSKERIKAQKIIQH